MPKRRLREEKKPLTHEREPYKEKKEEDDEDRVPHRAAEGHDTPSHEPPRLLAHLRAMHGFHNGSHHAIESVNVRPHSHVMVIGDHNYGDFVQALANSASAKTPFVYSHILPAGQVVTDDSDDLKDILSIIRKRKPDVIMFAFKMKNWPAHRKLYEVSGAVNPQRFFAAMPEITDEAIREILPAETALMLRKTVSLSKLLEASRGKEVLIKTRGKRDYFLKAEIPKAKKYTIHCDVPAAGKVFNLPSGEAFFTPKGMHGEIFFPKGSVIGDMGIVQAGVQAKFVNNELRGVEWQSLHDKHVVNALMQRLDAMQSFSCSELGIGTHPSVTLENAGTNPLLIEKVVNALHLGFGHTRASPLGNVRDNKFFDVVIPKSFVRIGSKQVIEYLGR